MPMRQKERRRAVLEGDGRLQLVQVRQVRQVRQVVGTWRRISSIGWRLNR